jgi:pimeloyl-ACP methyl ester carboxylesterase
MARRLALNSHRSVRHRSNSLPRLASSTPNLAGVLPALTFDGERAPLACATLVLEGGADPLVPAGTQQSFLVGNRHPLSRLETWPDGEHTIYNHAAARNAVAAEWFATTSRRLSYMERPRPRPPDRSLAFQPETSKTSS